MIQLNMIMTGSNMKLLSSVCALFFSAMTFAAPINNFVVFGDSLSDIGNLYKEYQIPVSPPYYKGRFSNGPLWIERLVKMYFSKDSEAHLQNYAYGGAGISLEEDPDDTMLTLSREIKEYLKDHNDKANADDLYVIWIGSNNYLNILDAMPDTELTEMVHKVTTSIQNDLEKLINNGARHIMVVNVPDLGRMPLAKDMDKDRDTEKAQSIGEFWSVCSKRHNDSLQQIIEELQGKYPEVKWVYSDVNLYVDEIMSDYERFGFTNITDACYQPMLQTVSDKSVLGMVSKIRIPNQTDCNKYLFFDFVHPSSPAHKIMAEKTKALLDDKGLEFNS